MSDWGPAEGFGAERRSRRDRSGAEKPGAGPQSWHSNVTYHFFCLFLLFFAISSMWVPLVFFAVSSMWEPLVFLAVSSMWDHHIFANFQVCECHYCYCHFSSMWYHHILAYFQVCECQYCFCHFSSMWEPLDLCIFPLTAGAVPKIHLFFPNSF